MTNEEFREKFHNCINGTIHENVDNVKQLLQESTQGMPKQTILSETDFNELGKSALRDKIYDLVYKNVDGTFIMVNGRIDAYCYNGGWIDTGYLYNIAKEAMKESDIFGHPDLKDYYENLTYQLDRSGLKTIDLLKTNN